MTDVAGDLATRETGSQLRDSAGFTPDFALHAAPGIGSPGRGTVGRGKEPCRFDRPRATDPFIAPLLGSAPYPIPSLAGLASGRGPLPPQAGDRQSSVVRQREPASVRARR